MEFYIKKGTFLMLKLFTLKSKITLIALMIVALSFTTAAFMLTLQIVKDYYGPGFDSNQAFVELIFKNTLNRLPTDGQAVVDGIAFWVGALEQGYNRGFMVSELIKAIYDYGPGGSQHHLADAATLAAYTISSQIVLQFLTTWRTTSGKHFLIMKR